MNLWKSYIRYLKNNPEHYWFKRKPFGWGWTPATWEGWFTLIAFLLLFIGSAAELAKDSYPTEAAFTLFALRVTIGIVGLITICFVTGEEPRWQWGFPKDDRQ